MAEYTFAEVSLNGRGYTVTYNAVTGRVRILHMASDVTNVLNEVEVRAIFERAIATVMHEVVEEDDAMQAAADVMQQEQQEAQRKLAEAAARDHQRIMGDENY